MLSPKITAPKNQLTLDFEPGLAERHRNLRDCIGAGIYRRGLSTCAIDLNESPGNLSNQLSDEMRRANWWFSRTKRPLHKPAWPWPTSPRAKPPRTTCRRRSASRSACWPDWGRATSSARAIEATSTTTWSSLTSWTAWTRWNMDPADPIVYTSPVRDLSAVLTSLVDVTALVQGDATIELRASETSDDPVADPGEWTAWGPADQKVVARYIQVRVTVDANVGDPIPMIDSLSYVVSAPLLNDYINDVDISTLTGSYRIGTGDVRVPMPNTYGTLLELQVVIQDASSGSWTWQLIDKTLTFGPRVQFKLNGTLADPDLVDFIVKGF